MKWPIVISPYECAIIPFIDKKNNSNFEKSRKIYKHLLKEGVDVILDDTDESFSSKIKKFNLIGIPFQIMIGKKSEDNLFEFKEFDEKTQNITLEEITKIIKKKIS